MRGAILKVNTGLLRSQLQLPDTTTVLRMYFAADEDALHLLIEDPSLPETRPGEMFPEISAEFTPDGFARYIG